jgi:membrane-bound ClpP family serine protease
LGVVGGFIIGVLGWQILCVFYKQQASSTVTDEDLLKANLAEVKTAIPASGVGQICVVVKGQRRYLSARSQGGTPIEEGAAVKIVGCPGGDAVLVQKT